MTTHQYTGKTKAKAVPLKAAVKVESKPVPKPEPKPAPKVESKPVEVVKEIPKPVVKPAPVESRNGTLARCADIARSFVSRGATSHSHSDLVALAIADAIEALKDKS